MLENSIIFSKSLQTYCYFFTFDKRNFKLSQIKKVYDPWINSINQEIDINATKRFFSKNYRHAFLSSIMPEFIEESIKQQLFHFSLKDDLLTKQNLTEGNQPFSQVELLIAKEAGIGCLLLRNELEGLTFSEIYEFHSQLKSLNSQVATNKKILSLKVLIKSYIESAIPLKNNWDKHFDKLLSYLVLSTSEELTTQQQVEGLLSLGLVVPGRSTPVEHTKEYKDNLFKERGISIFDDWTSLSLDDSFITIVSGHYKPNWKLDYFYIYLQIRFFKYYLVKVQNDLVESGSSIRKLKTLNTTFVDYINNNSFNTISSNFLPNTLYGFIYKTLKIKDEQDLIDKKIERIVSSINTHNSENTNSLLAVLSVLGFITAIFGITDGVRKIFETKGYAKESVDIISNNFVFYLSVIFLSVLIYFLIRRR